MRECIKRAKLRWVGAWATVAGVAVLWGRALGWYVAQAQAVKRAAEGFRGLGFEVFLPLYMAKHRGREFEVHPFGAYLFVSLGEGWREAVGGDEWRIRFGMVRFLPVGCEAPGELDGWAVERLRARALAGELTPRQLTDEISYTVGELVDVVSGPYQGHRKVLGQSRGAVEVGVPLLGRIFGVMVPKHQLGSTLAASADPPRYCRDWRPQRVDA